MSDIESLRQEAESLKNQIRVCIRKSLVHFFSISIIFFFF
jgi:hypothetical protein